MREQVTNHTKKHFVSYKFLTRNIESIETGEDTILILLKDGSSHIYRRSQCITFADYGRYTLIG